MFFYLQGIITKKKRSTSYENGENNFRNINAMRTLQGVELKFDDVVSYFKEGMVSVFKEKNKKALSFKF